MGKCKALKSVNISELVPYENNAKIHGKTQIRKLQKSIEKFGFLSPVLIDKDKNIIAGHGRVEAAKGLGIKSVPCISIEGLTDEERKAYILADNRLAEFGKWDKDIVEAEIGLLTDIDFDVDELNFNFDIIEDYIDEGRSRTNNAYNLDIAHDTELTNDFWQMPVIKNDGFIPEKLTRFYYAKQNKDKRGGIHFFIYDYQFERVWNKPEKYIDLLKQYECVLSPDFSLYMDMPMPMKIWNIYRSRQIGAFYQSAGIKVIPTISWAEKETFSFCFCGIPKKSIVAISTIGVKDEPGAMQIWLDGMDEMIKQIEPSAILVYGGEIEYDYKDITVKYYDNDVLKSGE